MQTPGPNLAHDRLETPPPMSDSAVYAIVLISAVAHATWNAMLKSSGDRLLTLASIRAVGLAAGIGVVMFVPLPARESLPYLLAAAAVHYLYYALMLNAYRVGDISQVYPIARGVAPLVVALLGTMFAGEMLGWWSALAIAILSSGILALAVSGKAINRHAVLFALGTGLTIASYSFLSGLGVRKSGSVWGYIACLELATGAGMTALACLRRRTVLVKFTRNQWRHGLGAGILSVAGYSIALWAMSRVAIAPVVAVRETSVVFAAFIGSVFLGEGFALRRVAAAVVVVVGMGLLTLAPR